MNKSVNLLMRALMYTCLMSVGISCTDSNDFADGKEDKVTPSKTKANDFDFSTKQKVDLIVDYSSYKLYGPVLFSIYNVNPIINEDSGLEYVDESIEPIFEAYTDANGKFDKTIELPAYAKRLHVVTGNFMIGLKRVVAEVVNGSAKAVLERPKAMAPMTRNHRAPGPGESTNDLSKMYSLWCDINTSSGAQSSQIYKKWVTPLGTWNSATGRPDYLLPSHPYTSQEFAGLYAAACGALNSGKTCKEAYRADADITLMKNSEVVITALGSMTCWNSSLGYYYYTDQTKPTAKKDLNIIMLFPNTQDGQRDLSWDYQNNIGTVRGDAIQLMYYPNIARGDFSGATSVFLKGTKIGFILKPNSWGNLGSEYCSKKTSTYYWNKKMNIWASSTDGFSTSPTSGVNYPNPSGEAHTAKFSYVANDGKKYSIISVEDACDDKDYDDLLFALDPSDAFTDMAEVENGKTRTFGIYAFEDRWPSRGDYDMNDAVVACEHELQFNSNGNVTKEIYYLTTYQNYVELENGLAVTLETKTTPKSIVTKKKAPGQSTASNTSFTKEDNVYLLTKNITTELGATYVFEITYSSGQTMENLSSIKPFIYRDEENGKRWEVHIPYEKPTSKMNMDYFGKDDDSSNPSKGEYYVRNGAYPFAFYLSGAKADQFIGTILNRANENRPISEFYPRFISWSTSKGANNTDWYLHPGE